MKTDTKERIFKFIAESGLARPSEIAEKFSISLVAVHKQLRDLLNKNKIRKVGNPPKVFYEVVQIQALEKNKVIEDYLENYIDQNYLLITPDGRLLYGLLGFDFYCRSHNLEFKKTAKEYYEVATKYSKFKDSEGIIDASSKIQESFGSNNYLDKLFYLDFYSVERFGKTMLSQLSFQAKQSQDKNLMKRIVSLTKNKIYYLLLTRKVEAIGFVPPTVDRKIQFQGEYEKLLNLPLPKVNLEKIIYDTPVQQKSLKKIEDRILNADRTIIISSKSQNLKIETILLIDDFVGSGATLNQIAKKLKTKGLCKNVYGLGITGSLKGFEVINQV